MLLYKKACTVLYSCQGFIISEVFIIVSTEKTRVYVLKHNTKLTFSIVVVIISVNMLSSTLQKSIIFFVYKACSVISRKQTAYILNELKNVVLTFQITFDWMWIIHALLFLSSLDGIHRVTALCTLRVTIITDEMLTNSITVRLENMSQERFLSPLLSLFAEGVAAVLSTTSEGVFIFNVQNDTDVTGHILNVTFSALLPGGAPDRFFPSEELQEQIYLNRTLLQQISSQSVLPFDDNICLREPCENYMKCVSVLKFDSSPPFIASETVLFRPIHPINGLRCRCPAGFTGDYCETEIDLCYSGPCRNNGRCRSREGGYTCECLEDFTGEFACLFK